MSFQRELPRLAPWRGVRLALIAAAMFLEISAHGCLAAPASPPQRVYSEFPTKFGIVQILEDTRDIVLEGKVLMKSGVHKDFYDTALQLHEEELESGPGPTVQVKTAGGLGSMKQIRRAVIAETGQCISQFVILDFTLDKPYVSERFGLNPEGKSCLTFKRAKWGKNESYIYLGGPLKYIYYTGGKVIGPID